MKTLLLNTSKKYKKVLDLSKRVDRNPQKPKTKTPQKKPKKKKFKKKPPPNKKNNQKSRVGNIQ